MPDSRSARRRVHLSLARHRRLLAAVLVGVGVLLLAQTLSPTPAPTVPVVAVGRDLPAGATVSSSDLRVVRLPDDLAPAAAFRDPGRVAGRVVAGPVRRGELVTDRRLVGRSLVDGYPSGTVAAPVRLADSEAVALLRVGDRVNVYAASAERRHAQTPVVTSATVVALPRADDGSGTDGALVVLAVTSGQAAQLTDASARTTLGVAVLAS